MLRNSLSDLQQMLEQIECFGPFYDITQILERLKEQITNNNLPTCEEMGNRLSDLRGKIRLNLSGCNFAYIPKCKHQYFEQNALFDPAVKTVFPRAATDIKEAGNCLALDLHDAAVFYLMRAVETGLRELARSLKVRISKMPLDYAGWNAVVKAIDDKLSSKIPKARGPKQTAALKFKHDLLADFKAFEVQRNAAMHGRSYYNEQETVGLFNRVRDFIQRLTPHVSK